jgi:hypothetical protein
VNLWLLNTFNVWQLGVILVGGPIILADGGLLVVRRLVPHLAQGIHNDIAGVVINLLAVVYGIVLAFVIVIVYQDFKAAESSVRDEATQLAQVYRDSQALSPEVAKRMKDQVVAYAAAVRIEEWPAMRHGHDAEHAWQHIEDMYTVLERYNPRTESQKTFYAEAVAKLNELVGSRRGRLNDAAEGLPGEFQVMLIGGALMLIGFLYFLGSRSLRTQLLMLTATASLLGFNLLLILVLDHPFAGSIAVSSAPFTRGSLAHLVGSLGQAHGH